MVRSPANGITIADLVRRIHLASALIRRGSSILLVASRYPNHAQPLWNLPGGRQLPRELLRDTVAREVLEETGLSARIGELLYLSESYDGDVHFTNCTFAAEVSGNIVAPRDDDHVAEARWVPLAQIAERLTVRVVREPLLAYLRGDLPLQYAGYADADISIVFPD
jgi:ADP-ribose pyrophosphatase YjhB (NUDIX family)